MSLSTSALLRILPHQLKRAKLEDLFARFEFGSLLDRVEPLLPVEGADEERAIRGPAGPGSGPSFRSCRVAVGFLDWGRPVGVAAEDTSLMPSALVRAESPACVWLAQADAEQGPEATGQ